VYAWGRSIFGRLGVGVAQDELFPTYVEIGTDDDKDSQSLYADSPSARDDSQSGLLCDRDGSFLHNKIVQVAAGAYHSLALSGTIISWSQAAPFLFLFLYISAIMNVGMYEECNRVMF
jgi:hypothetical protein